MLDFLTWSLSSAWRLKVAQNTFGFRFVVKWAYDTTNVGAYTWGVGGRVGWNVDLEIKAQAQFSCTCPRPSKRGDTAVLKDWLDPARQPIVVLRFPLKNRKKACPSHGLLSSEYNQAFYCLIWNLPNRFIRLPQTECLGPSVHC